MSRVSRFLPIDRDIRFHRQSCKHTKSDKNKNCTHNGPIHSGSLREHDTCEILRMSRASLGEGVLHTFVRFMDNKT